MPPDDEQPRRAPERSTYWLESMPPAERMFRIVALGSTRTFPDYDGNLVGGGLRIGEERLVSTSWALDALVESGEIATDAGPVDVHTWTLGAMLYVYGRTGTLTARAGAGLRAGLASATTKTSSAPRVVTPWGWPMLAISATISSSHSVGVEVSAEGGYVALPVTSGTAGVSIQGIWVSAQIGLAVIP
jgi:hypothetical protein